MPSCNPGSPLLVPVCVCVCVWAAVCFCSRFGLKQKEEMLTTNQNRGSLKGASKSAMWGHILTNPCFKVFEQQTSELVHFPVTKNPVHLPTLKRDSEKKKKQRKWENWAASVRLNRVGLNLLWWSLWWTFSTCLNSW